LEAVIHTASPFHFNVTDTRKDLLDPAIVGKLTIDIAHLESYTIWCRVRHCVIYWRRLIRRIVYRDNGHTPRR
jgi:hypothetical protein